MEFVRAGADAEMEVARIDIGVAVR